MIDGEECLREAIAAIYSNDLFSSDLYLKGGQALRISGVNTKRLSTDIDMSSPKEIDNFERFFQELKVSLEGHFDSLDLHLFDFYWKKRPAVKKDSTPDFWSGWAIEFKLIENLKKTEPIESKRRNALKPFGPQQTSKISIEISEYEYCESFELIQVGGVEVRSYSRVSLVLEKLRALCQHHPLYQNSTKNPSPRSRDLYDISLIYEKILKEGSGKKFFLEGEKHLKKVFKAKEVKLDLLDKIFDEEYVENLKRDWETVKNTVSGDLQDFDYYLDTVKTIARKLKKA